jgi:hypothetical protein
MNPEEEVHVVDLEPKTHESEWSDNLENLAKSWAIKAALQREMHNETSRHYRVMSTRLTLPLIMLTTLTSVGSFGAVDSEQYKIWMYVTGALNLISAFMASMIKYLKPDEKCSTHQRMGKMFDTYYREVTIQLSLSPEERDTADKFIEYSKNKLETLMNDSPLVSDEITRKTLCKNNMIPPNDFDIVIYGRENHNCPESAN